MASYTIKFLISCNICTCILLAIILNNLNETQIKMISWTDTHILKKMDEITTTVNKVATTVNKVITTVNQVETLLQNLTESTQMNVQNQHLLENILLQNLSELMTSQLNVQNQLLLQNVLPHDCLHLTSKGHNPSGVYTIKPSELSNFTAEVYCDMVKEGGGWTIFQRRFNGEVDFYRNWTEYEQGFGDVDGEYWARLHLLHLLTLSGDVTLRVELSSFDNETAYAEYQSFSVGDSSSNYTLTIGSYSGNAGDSLRDHNNRQFSTYDRDNDAASSGNCAQLYQGAWWYHACLHSNLNGVYLGPTDSGLGWSTWQGYQYLKTTTMMLRHNQ